MEEKRTDYAETVSIKQAAERLGVSMPTIYAWIKSGELNTIPGPSGSLKKGRVVSILEVDRISAYINQRQAGYRGKNGGK